MCQHFMQLKNITVKEYMAGVIYDQTNAKNISIIWWEKKEGEAIYSPWWL